MKKTVFKVTVFFTLFILLLSCNNNDDVPSPSAIIKTDDTNVEKTYTTLKVEGAVSSNGGKDITARGICWSENPNPTINDNKTTEVDDSFISVVQNLVANSTYYFRVYATSSKETTYSTEQILNTSALEETIWDFLMIHDTNTSWHADVTFNSDGTTWYEEPNGGSQAIGTWLLNGNTLSYNLGGDPNATSYVFTGTFFENTMSGTYTFDNDPDKTWSATLY